MSNDFNARIKQLLQQDSRYAEDAYRFISDAVTFTVNRLDEHRHVNAGELIAGIRDFAEHEYGVLARSVLESWGINSASDVGELVYHLISVQILSASTGDQRSDFDIDAEPFPPLATPDLTVTATLPKID